MEEHEEAPDVTQHLSVTSDKRWRESLWRIKVKVIGSDSRTHNMMCNNVLKKTGTLRKTKKSDELQIISDLQTIFNYKPQKERLEQDKQQEHPSGSVHRWTGVL